MDEIRQAMQVCPKAIQEAICALPLSEQNRIEEIRLRCGQTPTYLTDRERPLRAQRVLSEHLQQIIDRASASSVYAVQDMLKNGFLTIGGGHRLGICGRGVYKDGRLFSLRDISSVNLRVARRLRGVADQAAHYLWTHPRSTLILAPPGRGKTTLLRDLIRQISDRFSWRVSVVDERMELAAFTGSSHSLGAHTDVLTAVGKAQGIEMLVRAMNPQWIALDEITAAEDIEAISRASYCGVKFLATAHAACLSEMRKRPLYRSVLQLGVFENVILIDQNRQLQMGELTND